MTHGEDVFSTNNRNPSVNPNVKLMEQEDLCLILGGFRTKPFVANASPSCTTSLSHLAWLDSMYLGQLLSLSDPHGTELKNHIAKDWAKFAAYCDELTNSHYSLRRRMRLFAPVVQPSVLYGCVSWTMTRERELLIQLAQRKMLRKDIGTKRMGKKDEEGATSTESYVDLIQRATRKAEEAMANYGVPDWVGECCRQKFQWAGHALRRSDGRWSRRVLCWCPVGSRFQQRPLMWWSDSINKFFPN